MRWFWWSFRIGRLFDTDIRIHWTLPLVFLYYMGEAQFFRSVSPLNILLFIFIPLILLFLSVTAHEFGHVFAGRKFGLFTGNIILTPIGGMVPVGPANTPYSEFYIAFAGPAVNLALAAGGLAIYLGLGGFWGWDILLPFTKPLALIKCWGFRYTSPDNWGLGTTLIILYYFVEMQVFLFLFNMVVMAYPMDGGRCLYAVLWSRQGQSRGMVNTCKVAKVFAVLMGIVAVIYSRIFLAVIAVFVFIQAHQTEQMYKMSGGNISFFGGDPYEFGHYYDHKVERRKREQEWLRENRKNEKEDEVEDPNFQKKLDEILAKVHEHGMNKLTWRERRFLKKASRRYKDRND